MSEDYVQVETTIDSRDAAAQLADAIVRRRLAACAHVIGPIRATYWWQDAVQEDEEWLVLFKTRKALVEELERALGELHSYEVPELLVFGVRGGGRSYLDWIGRETGGT